MLIYSWRVVLAASQTRVGSFGKHMVVRLGPNRPWHTRCWRYARRRVAGQPATGRAAVPGFYRNRRSRRHGEGLGAEGPAVAASPTVARPFTRRGLGGSQCGRPNNCQQFAGLGTVLLAIQFGTIVESAGAGTGRFVDGSVLSVRQVCHLWVARGKDLHVQRGDRQGGAGAGSAKRKVYAEHCICEFYLLSARFSSLLRNK